MKKIYGVEVSWEEAQRLVQKLGKETFSPNVSVRLTRMEDTYSDMQGPEILISDLDEHDLKVLEQQASCSGYEVYPYESGLYGVSVNTQSGQCTNILLKKIAGLSFTPEKILYDGETLTLIIPGSEQKEKENLNDKQTYLSVLRR